jgi:2-polyprenyl-3-methyl-5-hydroxy-6-metoxy-1,4-benzoquinol methylase
MKLLLPARGSLRPNNEHDPLPYYYRPLLGWLYRKRLQMGLDLVPVTGKNVLEVGVGSGILIPTLSAMFPAYTGADLVLAEGLAPLVETGCQAQFVTADLLVDSDLPEARFDVVICLSVLEHIADSEHAAASLARTLVKGGTLVAGYPMVNRLMARFFRTIGFPNIEDHHVAAPADIDRALRRVLRRVARKSLPPFAPISWSLYQCTAWRKE